MRISRLIVLFALLMSIGIMFGATARSYYQKLGFASGDITQTITNTGTSESAPNYVLNADILSTPGEVISTSSHNATQIRIARVGTNPDTWFVGAYLQLAAFSTQWVAGDVIQFTIVYTPTQQSVQWTWTITPGTTTVTIQNPIVIIPQQGTTLPLNPAVLVLPENGATGLGYVGQNLTWTAGSGLTPTGYKVYFGTDNPPTNIINGVNQTGTSYATGALLQNQTYYWQIIPFADTQLAENCPIWSFTTRGEINPNPATNPNPTDASTVYSAVFPYEQALSWSAPLAGQAPTGYKLYFGTGSNGLDLGNVLTTSQTINAPGNQTWQIVPYYTDPGTRSTRESRAVPLKANRDNQGRGDAVGCPVWNFTVVQLESYTVSITSVPTDADIYINGIDSGFNTPHVFSMVQGTSSTYTVQKAGYTWSPLNYVVENIQANASQEFTGTIITCTVDLTSAPTGAAIYVNGQDSGFVTPYQFTMNYGTSAAYTLQLGDYSWTPSILNITNIQANTSQHFVGSLGLHEVTITSVPTGADIYVNGTFSGFTTPYIFALEQGSGATYSVQKAGYTWEPANYVVSNITTDLSYNFVGTIITYTVDIASTPVGANIYIDGQDTGFVTPHQFVMNHGSSATYTVQKAGYSWIPASQVVNNIQANQSYNFTGSLLTYTVDITSNPSGAQIFTQGFSDTISRSVTRFGDTGFTTPHTFTLEYGTSVIYYVEKVGYTWAPENFVINNIQNNTGMNFVGTPLSYNVTITSTPTNADIFIDGVDSGFNTPHVFTMNYGTDAVYSVQKAGYTWAPQSCNVTNVTENVSQDFVGTMLTYAVDLTSTPADADIFVNGVDSGFNTPHIFTLNYGDNAVYSVQKTGYTWAPNNFTVNNITTDTAQNFVGTLITYTVDVLSTPSDADIFVNGVDSGFNTPHQFVMNYGSGAVYSVQKAGYTWAPDTYAIDNIQANASQTFTGTIITYNVNVTSTPFDADIFVNGIDSGFNTPHVFTMNYGTSAVYSVQKTGYSWLPVETSVNNIQTNQNVDFAGTLLTYNVDISSTPAGAIIKVDGQDTGFVTPHVFVMNYGTSATYSVQQAGYTWAPAFFAVNNIQANASQNFVGTLLTYVVTITSNPTNADIYVNGQASGFTTPYQFTMNYGSNAVYTVQKAGYIWVPQSLNITNIQANQEQNFVGTLLTNTVAITSTPSNARIYVNGQDSGLNTPYTFTMLYGSSAVYTVQKAGYNWNPASLVVENIQQNMSQEFVGSLQVFNVDITSNPSGANIYVNGIDSGFATPHQFNLTYGSGATYTVQQAGYSWSPANYVVSNITSDKAQNFVGSLLTYTVVITSSPTNADILVNGVDSGFNTPYTFTMTYGSSAVYTVQKAGYTWNPGSYSVNNIQANAAQNFAGTLLTYTVNITSTPAEADIYVNGIDSGLNTPHTFTLNYGSSATYSIQKAGYTWNPGSYAVNNIQANAAQNFTGTQLTYTVNITSIPSDADIYVNGVDSGFNTPHVFTLPYGSNAVYTVQKTGYSWAPANFNVTNITANASQNFVGSTMTYTVNVTSNPSNVDIFVNGVDSGFNTPYTFTMTHGSSAVYTVQKPGFSWLPGSYAVNNIQANAAQNFTGTLLTYTVNITSNPTDADIFVNGVDSGFNTPHVFTMPYGSNAVYTVQKAGYSWSPSSYVVNNIQANATQNFTGALLTYTVNITSTPADADIYVNGVDSGFNTPHVFTLTHGSGAVYTVQKTGYIWSPASFAVANIQGNTAQNFTGAAITLNVSPSNQNASYQAGTATFNIQSNSNWTITEAEDWLAVTPMSGTGNRSISVNYQSNTSISNRIGQIHITNNLQTYTITINQAGSPATLNVVSNVNLGYLAGVSDVEITSNVDWTVTESISWLSISQTSGTGNSTLSFTYDNNLFNSSRTGQIVLMGNGLIRIITITQESAPVALTVSPEVQSVSAVAGRVTYSIVSNTTWTVVESVNWLTVVPKTGINNGNFTVIYNANTSTQSRTAEIVINGIGMSETVTIVQEGASVVLDVTPMQQNVTNYAGTAAFTVTSNVPWTVIEDVDWISITSPAKNTNGNFVVSFMSNQTSQPRTGIITVTGGEIVREIMIIQAAGYVDIEDNVQAPIPMLSVYPNPFSINATIRVDVKEGSSAVIDIYSSKGQHIKSLGSFAKGSHTLNWDGKDESGRACSNGFYIVRYKSAEYTKTTKVMLIQK